MGENKQSDEVGHTALIFYNKIFVVRHFAQNYTIFRIWHRMKERLLFFVRTQLLFTKEMKVKVKRTNTENLANNVRLFIFAHAFRALACWARK